MEELVAALIKAGSEAGMYKLDKVVEELKNSEKGIEKLAEKWIESCFKNFFPSNPLRYIFVKTFLKLPAKFVLHQTFKTFDAYLEEKFTYSNLTVEEFIPKFLSYLKKHE